MNLTIRKSFLAFKEAIRFSVTRQYQTTVSAADGCDTTAPGVTEHLADWAVSRLVQLPGAGPAHVLADRERVRGSGLEAV